MAIRGAPAILAPVKLAALLACSLACLAACGGPQRARPGTGAIAGLTRDRDSGDPIAKAEIRVRSAASPTQFVTASSDLGRFDVAPLLPGRYSLSAAFAGQPVDVVNIDVRAGEVTTVELVFTLGQPDPIRIDLGAAVTRSHRRATASGAAAPP